MAYAGEERKMEAEALTSIYEDQFKIVEPTIYEVNLREYDIKIYFILPEEYPQDIPFISVVHGSCPSPDLESLLHNTAQKSIGEAMIFNLVEEAKEWVTKYKPVQPTTLPLEDKKYPDGNQICKFFLEGKCKFGSKCFNKHETGTNTKPSSTDLQEKVEKEDRAAQKNIKGAQSNIPSGVSQKKLEERSQKKSPMKTAGDVISRIKWDEELSPKHFSVGYLDRFLGIVEKAFTEFSWKDLGSVDPFVDLAIPRHRIQYFKYLGEIVWDKRDRTDKVFGSTGGKETIMDVKKRVGSSKKEEEDESDSYHVLHEVADGHESVREKSGPNYFIAVPVVDSVVTTNISKLQKVIQSELEPDVCYDLIPSQRLHITLLMLALHSETEVINAKNILKSVQPVLVSILPTTEKLKFCGLGLFRDQIIYARVEPDPRLSWLVQILKFKFSKAGISLDGNKTVFVPHVSILRFTKGLCSAEQTHSNFTKVVNSYQAFEFGEQGIHSLALYSKFLPKDADGSHHKVLCFENSLISLSSTLPKKLMQFVDYLFQSEKVSDTERTELQDLFQSDETAKVETAIGKIEEFSKGPSSRIVLILRGIPGCGKTYLVENSTEAKQGIELSYCSSKQLFYRAGAVTVDQSELNIAEAYCRSCFMDALFNLRGLVVVDDVHSRCWEYSVYKRLARVFGYACYVLEIEVTESENIVLCHKNCSSGLSLGKLVEYVQEWETDPTAIIIEPWFNKPKTEQNRSICIRKFLKTV